MNDNVMLIKDIRELRSKVRDLEKKLAARKTKRSELDKQIKGIVNEDGSD